MTGVIVLVTVGLVAGAVASALGIGGGIVFVPVLAVGFAMEQATAQGTSLAVIAPTAAVATLAHLRYGRVVWKAAGPVAFGGIVGAAAGAQLALAADPLVLRRLFAAMLVLLATRLALQQRRGGGDVSDLPSQ